ncbi:S1 domain-containing RNA-binding protein [Sutcliffiella cohnii]|uniref:RNA-binding protein S1 n=1 Tax=Sutcliffiella cohnii TaxID=33932 RepID=A0A223KX55_9BACI|nr:MULTISPECIES: S1 domain-containing RNA-binding protein [Sutcliffiella]AST93993.1 RNA-binding protein S1 [Sutcliffiella cohnii]MED4018403.1 S1 domain-containing RNA-binding protein [Sutcliffiella cohnii]WBL15196.1 S1 domain-containing RNA-binding protein [Sutcliffiella sp. NC1]
MSIEVGSKLQGKVTGITNFGAFVELPGNITGLVHISEVADNYVKDINEHLKVGDEVQVKVINVEKDGKIGLSIKKASETYREPQQRSNQQRPKKQRDDFRPKENFEQKMARFLKDSEDRLASLKRNTESKRGGRGARRG